MLEEIKNQAISKTKLLREMDVSLKGHTHITLYRTVNELEPNKYETITTIRSIYEEKQVIDIPPVPPIPPKGEETLLKRILDEITKLNTKVDNLEKDNVEIKGSLSNVNTRLDKIETRIDRIEIRLDDFDEWREQTDNRLSKIEEKLN